MAIDVTCPYCQGLLSAPAHLAGRKVRCAGCNGVVDVPAGAPAPPPAPGPLPAKPVTARRVGPPPDRPARPTSSGRYKPRREWDDDEDDDEDRPRRRPRRRSGGGHGAAIAVGLSAVGLLTLVAFGAVLYFALRAADDDAADAGANPPPAAANNNPLPPLRPPPIVIGAPVPPPDPGPIDVRGPDPDGPILIGGPAPPGPPGWPPSRVAGARTTAGLVGKYRDRVVLEASSAWGEPWTVASAFDGNDRTSWFNHGNPGGADPWVKVTFPEDVTVTRVTVRGNREPNWRQGYGVRAGRVELLSADGAVIASRNLTPVDEDFTFAPGPAGRGVRAVRFVSTREESPGRNMAVGELVVE